MLRHHIAVAFRNIRRAPFTSAVNLLTLAVGLVCFVTAYGFVTFWGTAEQHFAKAPDLYVLTLTIKNRENGGPGGIDNVPRVPDMAAEFLRSDYPAIAKTARSVVIDSKTMVASGGRAERLFGIAVDAEFLDMFDLPFVAGDPHSALSSPRSAVITHEYAVRFFGNDNPIGKTLVIGNSVDATVTGVIDPIPEPSHLGRSAGAMPVDLITSSDMPDALRGGPAPPWQSSWFSVNSIVYLYLPPWGGLSPDALRAQLGDFVARHVPAESLKNQDYRFGIEPVSVLLTGTDDFYDTGLSLPAALLLLGGLVLGVACVNYTNLAAARAARRVREIGVRKALGASPVQVAMQSFAEAAAFAIGALVVALAVFIAVQPLLAKRLLGAEVDASFFGSLSVWPALVALVIAVALASGAYPAFVLSRVRPVSAVAIGRAQLGSPLFSTLLVGVQFGVASFLLIALTVISLQNAEMRRNALASIEDPLVLIANPAQQTKVATTTLRERLGNVPQVRGVTEIQIPPWEGLLMTNLASSPDPTSAQHAVATRQVGYDFFDVFNVARVAGRVFDRDHAEDAPRPAGGPASQNTQPLSEPPPTNVVVDRTFVAAFGLGTPEEAIDKLIYRALPPNVRLPAPPPPLRVIGVVENRSFSFFKTPSNTGAMYGLQTNLELTVARVAAADLDTGLRGIDAAWRELAPNVAASRRFLAEVFEGASAQYLRVNQLFAVLAVMAFGICVAGLFGMAIFVAGRRRREIGVRKTLGASTPRMVALLLVSFSRPVVIANLIAWPAGYFAARAYLNQFSQSIPLTPWPFLLSVAITLAVTCAAVLGQTVRAARTTPAEVLRQD